MRVTTVSHMTSSLAFCRDPTRGLVDTSTLKHLAGEANLNMTRLGLSLSEYVNGVAERHAQVAGKMFPGYRMHAITNGVHPFTWVCASVRELYDRYVPGWCHEPELLVRVDRAVPDAALWAAHVKAKQTLIQRIRAISAGRSTSRLRSSASRAA